MTHHDETARIASVFSENVRRALRSLSPEQVADLTDGLEADIIASLADGGDLPEVDEYARDLMRAAGIAVPGSTGRGVVSRVKEAVSSATARATHFSSGLAPAWWVFRAWVLMQAVGFAVSNSDSTYWFLGQWGGEGGANGFVGVALFALLLVASVRVGRDGWMLSPAREKLVSAVITIFALVLLFSEGTAHQQRGWFEYQSTGAPGCDQPVPDLVGLTVLDAQPQLIQLEAVQIEVIDRTSGYDVTQSAGIDRATVVAQEPVVGDFFCGHIRLFIELGTGTAVVPGMVTTTLAPSSDSSFATTTTAPKSTTTSPKSTTTTKPKASTTTTP